MSDDIGKILGVVFLFAAIGLATTVALIAWAVVQVADVLL